MLFAVLRQLIQNVSEAQPAVTMIERLEVPATVQAVLVPGPRGNLVRYHEILAPNAQHRSNVVPAIHGCATAERQQRSQAQALGTNRPDGDHYAPTVAMLQRPARNAFRFLCPC